MTTLAVLGSTRGTSMQALIDTIEQGALASRIALVVSNKPDAYILERARRHGIEARFLDPQGRTREKFDEELAAILREKRVDLILLVGYMRWLSPAFVRQWKGRIMNVHPSLLPAFAGGTDTEVHRAVLESGAKESGCTVHFVDEGKDTGPVIVQKKCRVSPADTVESLKAKVQQLEGRALLEAIVMFQEGALRHDGRESV